MTSNLPSLGSQLDSARAKLRRASQHLRALKQSLDRFGKGEPYRPGAKTYDPGVVGFLKSREVIERITRTELGIILPSPIIRRRMFISEIPLTITITPAMDYSLQFLRWSILIGEVVHNIGSALDNLIWELAQPLPPAPPSTASSKTRSAYQTKLNSIGFPYTKQRSNWGQSCTRYLALVPDAATRIVLEEFQAFYAWENEGTAPETFPLEIVHELWNRDKHRTVNLSLIGSSFQFTRVRMPNFFPGVDNLPSEIVELLPLRPIEGETEVAKLLVHFPHEIELPNRRFVEVNVLVQPTFTLGILFGQGSPGEGLNALDRLRAAHKLATQVVDRFL